MPTDDRVRVLIADDDSEVREAIAQLIATEGSFDLVGQAGDAAEAVELAARLRPDVALLDVRMPGGGGPRATRSIRNSSPRTRVVALSAHDDRETVLEMIRAGAVGYLLKGRAGDELLTAIQRSARGQTTLSSPVANAVVEELAARLEGQERDDETRRQKIDRIRSLLFTEAIAMVFQPIADLRTGEVVGFEALARFEVEPRRTPDVWFDEAESVGLALQLELVAVRQALKHFDQLPQRAYLSFNVSPATLLSPHFVETVDGVDPRRLVIEITEHAPVSDYEALADSIRVLRSRGAKLAVDDVGAGFASLRHILRLSPDVIKLDRELCSDVDTDPARHALASALIVFADQIGSSVVAEGLERETELLTLRSLGVRFGQGYFLARPNPLPVDPADIPRMLAVPVDVPVGQSSEIA
jgi:EAL domain-containing protein (putative c-di-GMP-specific phosphodiesterase class I)/ActR/RegA family two-component response regulator